MADHAMALRPDMIDVPVRLSPLGLNTRRDPQRTLERLAIARRLDAQCDPPTEAAMDRPIVALGTSG